MIGPWCPASTLDLNAPAFAGACHPNDMKPRRGGVVLLALSPPFWGWCMVLLFKAGG